MVLASMYVFDFKRKGERDDTINGGPWFFNVLNLAVAPFDGRNPFAVCLCKALE
ncbi:hypothetical protein RchiOBHm_Chr6g0284681 [Rosa chinensis]|uniref:DUF4283 domain-containing protein n=1 Tax=Rosa chinensis TaxID=74649 RepID=A0A2P6PUC9_ROSCH|nr:hypothetical protein RchiOBHm_Chr6g0284681 [Rosa chinensis]